MVCFGVVFALVLFLSQCWCCVGLCCVFGGVRVRGVVVCVVVLVVSLCCVWCGVLILVCFCYVSFSG